MHLREGPLQGHSSHECYLGSKLLAVSMRIEPRTADWEARTLPLCYAIPPPGLIRET